MSWEGEEERNRTMGKRSDMAKKLGANFPEGSKKHEMAESPSMERKERKDGKKDPKGSFGARKDKGKDCK